MLFIVKSCFVFWILYVVHQSQQTCPAQFPHKIQHLCVGFETKEYSFCEAAEQCTRRGGQLLGHSVQVIEQVMNLTIKAISYWIGVTSLYTEYGANEQKWYFLNHNMVNIPNTIWRAGQPNNNQGKQHCVKIKNSKFNDKPCNSHYQSICMSTHTVWHSFKLFITKLCKRFLCKVLLLYSTAIHK